MYGRIDCRIVENRIVNDRLWYDSRIGWGSVTKGLIAADFPISDIG